MGKKIYDAANEPKYYYFPEFDNHMMTYDENMLKTLSNFLNEIFQMIKMKQIERKPALKKSEPEVGKNTDSVVKETTAETFEEK